MTIQILARSSSGDEPYTITFVCDEGPDDERIVWSLFCNCKAASIGQWCSHRRDLLKGDSKRLADLGHESLLREALAWPGSVQARAALDLIEDELRLVEYDKKQLKEREAGVKRKLAAVFDGPQSDDHEEDD